MCKLLLLLVAAAIVLTAHDAHGRSNSPPEARHLKSPLKPSGELLAAARPLYDQFCSACHGSDGKARTPLAGKLPIRPTNLAEYLMESMRDGEIYWVITHGIERHQESAPLGLRFEFQPLSGAATPPSEMEMPSFEKNLGEMQRWEVVLYVRDLRRKQKALEVAQLGPYAWNLPPGFPFPNVPRDNPMTAEKVELGRHLFYDKRLSLNQSQSCASCHRQEMAFTDGRGRGLGSTGQMHPRGPMSLVNVAYSPVLTWVNPNLRKLEDQALVPLFGEDPVELGMAGKEELLAHRLRELPVYQKLFAAAFPGENDAFTIANAAKAIASFERTILSGDSPYDRYKNADDPEAISESAKRGEALFFSERLECFHCHGGFNFTGTVDYLDKGFAEVEFHNTGLYNLKGKYSYPQPNLGLYTFTQQNEDIGKFKAPTLRNIAVTAPYMHDGSIKTLTEAIEHYSSGGRTIRFGPNAGVGAQNPNRSEFVKPFTLTTREKADLLAFLRSLTDETVLANSKLSNPWEAAITRHKASQYILHGQVVEVFPEAGSVTLYHDKIPGLMGAMRAPNAMEYLVSNPDALKDLRPGQPVVASVRRQGRDLVLDNLRPSQPAARSER